MYISSEWLSIKQHKMIDTSFDCNNSPVNIDGEKSNPNTSRL